MEFPVFRVKLELEMLMFTYNLYILKAESVMKTIKDIDFYMLEKFMRRESHIKLRR